MDKTEKYNIASMDIHGHGCDVTELNMFFHQKNVQSLNCHVYLVC